MSSKLPSARDREYERSIRDAEECDPPHGCLALAPERCIAHARPHIANGRFQSDKYPTCPPGKVPLSVEDPTAQDLLWEYAQRRRAVDAEFADDLEYALNRAGYRPKESA